MAFPGKAIVCMPIAISILSSDNVLLMGRQAYKIDSSRPQMGHLVKVDFWILVMFVFTLHSERLLENYFLKPRDIFIPLRFP